ncbi:spore germination protein [Sporomusa aerivorans]|uniref:spore germination protein n=1 Tax=Sporomusa aerivorans TaxID=204936 RepID=UPI003529EBCE
MKINMVSTAVTKLTSIFGYMPPVDPDPFVLDENRPYDSAAQPAKTTVNHTEIEQFHILLRYSQRLENHLQKAAEILGKDPTQEDLVRLKLELEALEKQWSDIAPIRLAYEQGKSLSELPLSTSLEENKRVLKEIYQLPRNKDIIVRDFSISGTPYKDAALVYTEGLVNSNKLERFVLQPLMNPQHPWTKENKDAIGQFINKILPNASIKRADLFGKLEEGVNRGDTVVIIDGLAEAIVIESKGWEHRNVSTPRTEQTVRGSQSAFNENLRVNTGLIRSILHSSDLVTEIVMIGKRGQLSCAIMYLSSIANESLVAEVRRRLEGISTDYIVESGQLVQFIEDYPRSIFPQTISTERPDRVANYLVEGHVALVLEGNPFAQIVPASFFSFFHSAEDFSVKSSITNFMRVLRLFGALISSVLPSLYIAIAYFHQEAIPTELLLAIAGSRENVPFPAIFEVMMMEVSFELIREAGVRIPGVLGSTIGIVGAIILGQAAVTARIVSPIIVVIIAITGLASFTIPEYRMASAIRIIRFWLLIFSWIMGLVGLAFSLLGLTVLLCRLKSFGMPYMVPIGPRTIANYDVVLRGQVYSQEKRPDELNTKDRQRQPEISRLWKKQPSSGEDD